MSVSKKFMDETYPVGGNLRDLFTVTVRMVQGKEYPSVTRPSLCLVPVQVDSLFMHLLILLLSNTNLKISVNVGGRSSDKTNTINLQVNLLVNPTVCRRGANVVGGSHSKFVSHRKSSRNFMFLVPNSYL